jgi:hypothetical protein
MKPEISPNELFIGTESKHPPAWKNFMKDMKEKYPNMNDWSSDFYLGLIFTQAMQYKVQRFHHLGRRDAKIIFKSEKHKNMFLLRWS